jgi:hypothetical protein
MDIKVKKSFTLLISIILFSIFSYLAVCIIENKAYSTNIDKLKYLHLQARIHLDYLVQYILNHTNEEIQNIQLNDDRFIIDITLLVENNTTCYHIAVSSRDDSKIRVYKEVIK